MEFRVDWTLAVAISALGLAAKDTNQPLLVVILLPAVMYGFIKLMDKVMRKIGDK